MFGVSFGEVLLIAVVALVVFDPRRLPEVLGTAGKWIAKVRRMTTEMRRQTGIDEILRQEGISGGISELRSMLRPDLMAAAQLSGAIGGGVGSKGRETSSVNAHGEAVDFDRYREYPTEGADSYGAIPEDLLEPAPSPAPTLVTPPTADGVTEVAPVASATSAASTGSGEKEAE